MPYSPSERFDPAMIFRGIAGAGDALGGGLADAQKKKEQAEAQMAGSLFGFQTLKKAGLIDPEEETKFLQGNANQRNAIVMAATPRLVQKFQTQKEANDQRNAQMQRNLQLTIAKMHYANNGGSAQSPVVDPRTGMMWNGRQWVLPPTSTDSWRKNVAVARGTLKGGEFYNDYKGAENGDMVKVMTPQGKEIVMPWKSFEARTTPQSVPDPPAAAAPAYGPTPPGEGNRTLPTTNYGGASQVAAPPATAIILGKDGHHYEVDHASKKVLRQID